MGTENPADLTTRGLMGTQLRDSSLWSKGPQWLRLEKHQWPTSHGDVEHTNDSVGEMRLEDQKKMDRDATLFSLDCKELIDSTRFSSFRRLLRVTAYVLRFLHNIRNPKAKEVGELLTKDIDAAEWIWIRLLQGILKKHPKYALMEVKDIYR